MLGLIFPYEATVIPLYYDFQAHNLTGTYWALILPQIGQSVTFGTFWMRAFFLIDAAHAARGGAHRRRGAASASCAASCCRRRARRSLTLCLLVFMYTWNEFLLALVMLQGGSQHDGAARPQLLRRRDARGRPDQGRRRRGARGDRPIVLVYIFLQRHFIRGVLAGAIKE